MCYKLNKQEYKKALLSNGITITELAKSANVSHVSINKIYNGGVCRAKTANKIAKALNAPVTDLFE